MKNTIIDFIRVPVDERGDMIYDMEEIDNFWQAYKNLFPDHKGFLMPANITIWQDLDLVSLKSVRDYLNTIIEQKEKEQK